MDPDYVEMTAKELEDAGMRDLANELRGSSTETERDPDVLKRIRRETDRLEQGALSNILGAVNHVAYMSVVGSRPADCHWELISISEHARSIAILDQLVEDMRGQAASQVAPSMGPE